MEKEILEGNKLIADFMGLVYEPETEIYDSSSQDPPYTRKERWLGFASGIVTPVYETLQYNSSWDWLMPVIRKMKSMQHDPNEMFMGTTLDRAMQFANVLERPIYAPINVIWLRVVEFIKWYNNQKK